jgi:hypothetical protein
MITHDEAEKIAKKELIKEAMDATYNAVAHEILYEGDGREEVDAWIKAAKTTQERFMIESAIRRFNRVQQRFLQQQKQKEQEQQEKQNEQKKEDS